MKVNKKIMYSAVARTLFETNSSAEIAKATAEALSDEKSGAVEVNTARNNGFVLRCKKDATISDNVIYKALASVSKELLNASSDEVEDYMTDKFDVSYDSKYVNVDYAQEIFEISHNGRLIYIEADL